MKLEVMCGNHDSLRGAETCGAAGAGSALCAEEELGSDGDCAASSPPPAAACGTSKPYTRRAKPPFSYIALIAMAIRDSASGRLTLAEINDYLMKKFPFFRGSYTGWRNSVRHNLSLNDCFLKVLRDAARPWGKDNYWMLNPHSEYTFADGVFRRRRKRINSKFSREPQEQPPPPPLPVPVPRSAAAAAAARTDAGAKFTSSFSIESILSAQPAAAAATRRDSHTGLPFVPALSWPRYSDLLTPRSHTPATFPDLKAACQPRDCRAAQTLLSLSHTHTQTHTHTHTLLQFTG